MQAKHTYSLLKITVFRCFVLKIIIFNFCNSRSTLSEIFEIIDLDGNGLISLEEYNFFELRTSGEKCDEDAWAVCRGECAPLHSQRRARL